MLCTQVQHSAGSNISMITLILYSKPGCHLCEGLQQKLEALDTLPFALEVRDITTDADWLQAYQLEVPVLHRKSNLAGQPDQPLPRPSPRLSGAQLARFLQPFLAA